MNTARVFNRQTGIIAVAVTLLLATFISALVSAAQVTQRSIQLSSSSAGATGVAYTVNFTAAEAAGAVVVDFCENSPLVGEACTAPTGFKVNTATAAGGFTTEALTTVADNKVLVTGAVASAAATSIPLTNVTNPTAAGSIYARVLTFADSAAAVGYTSLAPGTYKDQGGMALSITPTVAISGDVLESLTFCIANKALTASCANAGAVGNEPVLKLGEDLGNGVVALDSTKLSTGNIYTQLTTNAANGATVYLKSDAAGCGGLIDKARPASCDIAPALLADFAAGAAKFGVKTATATSTPTADFTDAIGVLKPAGVYSSNAYAFNYVDASTGVTSTFGDLFLDTDNAPANNQNMMLTFGVSVNGNTPAGSYSTALSLIATGKF